MNVQALKGYTTDKLDTDEMVALSMFGKALKAEFEALKVPVPEFIDVQLRAIKRDVRAKFEDQLAAERVRLKAQLEGLRTTAERKAEVTKQLAAIEDQLAE